MTDHNLHDEPEIYPFEESKETSLTKEQSDDLVEQKKTFLASQEKVNAIKEGKVTVALQPIKAKDSGVIVGASHDEQFRLARLYCASGLVPKDLNTPEKVFTALQFIYELGLKGITSLRNVCVINGVPSLFGDLPLAICKRSGNMKEFREWIFDKDMKEISVSNGNIDAEIHGAACRSVRRDDGNVVETWFTMAEAKNAGLFEKSQSIWKKYKRRMIQMRARSQNLKDNFGDCLYGSAIAEYDFNSVVEGGQVIGDGAGSESIADKINEEFLDTGEK